MNHIGKINIFADIETEAVKQSVEQFEKFLEGQDNIVQAVLLPDCHFGFSVPIGSVFASIGKIYPSAVGMDIGCGMCAVPTTFNVDDVRKNAKKIFDNIYRDIPVGFNHNKVDTNWIYEASIPRSNKMQEIFAKNGLKQLGSLGGGNHFHEVGVDENNVVWVVIHSGSRGIGHATATHYMKLASGIDKAVEGHDGFDVDSQDGKDYIMDLNFCLEFALKNRKEMMHRIDAVLMRYCTGFTDWDRLINRNHNHAELKDGLWIHRKGATHAEAGMMGVIPGNMKDGSFIVEGLGNPDSLCSSSHGAGRVMGRKAAQKALSMEKFTESMKGITALVTKDTLDESSLAYKDIYDVMRLQDKLVKVVAHVKPIINIKAVGDC